MSNYHILIQDLERKSVSVVFHVPIPATGVNLASVQWREAVKKERAFNKATGSVLPDIIAAEQTQIDNGEIIEVMQEIGSSPVASDAVRKVQIEAEFNKVKVQLLSEKQITLAWIGYQANVA
jgi:hypothetical protein